MHNKIQLFPGCTIFLNIPEQAGDRHGGKVTETHYVRSPLQWSPRSCRQGVPCMHFYHHHRMHWPLLIYSLPSSKARLPMEEKGKQWMLAESFYWQVNLWANESGVPCCTFSLLPVHHLNHVYQR